jgi:hypothetical protein
MQQRLRAPEVLRDGETPVSIRYETEDAVNLREVGGREDRGATALDPEAMERAQPRSRAGNGASNGVPIASDPRAGSQPTRRSNAVPVAADPRAGSQPTRRSNAVPVASDPRSSSQPTRRSNVLPTEPARRSSAKLTSPMPAHRNSPAPVEPMGGITQPYQRPRGKRNRVSELDPNPTQTFGPADPLPPSPAMREQTEGWFRPSLFTESIPDLSALAGDTNRTYDPHIHNLNLPGLTHHEEIENAVHPPQRRPLLDMQARPWLFPALLAATCLAVGMVLGALLFGNRTGGGAPAERDQVVIRCSDPPAR